MIYQRNGFKVGDRDRVKVKLINMTGTITNINYFNRTFFIKFDDNFLADTWYRFDDIEKLNESEEKWVIK